MNKIRKYKVKRWWNRWKMVFHFGLIDSKEIAATIQTMDQNKKSRLGIYWDMIYCYYKYHIWTNQYKKERFWALGKKERDDLGAKYRKRNEDADMAGIMCGADLEPFRKEYNRNRRFLAKYSSFKWEKSEKSRTRRTIAYREHYNMGRGSNVQYGVILISEHGVIGQLKIGERVKFTRNVDIDYTGGLTIGNGVNVAEGAKILTHGHSYLMRNKSCINKYYPNTFATPLTIGDNVFIGIKAVIMPGVTSIGENSIISAGAIVTRPVPPNSIVTGNPAKVTPIPVGMRTLFEYDKNMYDYDVPAKI